MYGTSSDHVPTPDAFRVRRLPDVPEDVDYIMEHLNDPNYDLRKPPSVRSHVYDVREKKYRPSDIDGDSHYDSDRYSTGGSESRNSTAIEFDE